MVARFIRPKHLFKLDSSGHIWEFEKDTKSKHINSPQIRVAGPRNSLLHLNAWVFAMNARSHYSTLLLRSSFASILTVVLCVAEPAAGQTTWVWVGGAGTWDNTSPLWYNLANPGVRGAPTTGDIALIYAPISSGPVINVGYGPDSTLYLGGLGVGQYNTPGVSGIAATLNIGAQTLYAASEDIGDAGLLPGGTANGVNFGIVESTEGGVNSVGSNGLTLGGNAGDDGRYGIGGLLTTSGLEVVGYGGSGTVYNDSVNTITGGANLILGYQKGALGSYYLGEFISHGFLAGGGTPSAPIGTNTEYIGYSGSGQFFQFSGINTIAAGQNLVLANDANTSSGNYYLYGGSLSVGGNEYIGLGAIGAFYQQGGSNTISNNGYIYIAYNNGSNGTYTLNGGSLSVAQGEVVGLDGTGTFNHSAGTNTLPVGSSLVIGRESDSSGTYYLSGAAFLSVGGSEIVGDQGPGSFNQSGGTNSSSAEYIGYDGGIGNFVQSGGENHLNGHLFLGYSSTSTGTYTLTGGSLVFDNIGSEVVGYDGAGHFVQTGGTNTNIVSLTQGLIVAFDSGSVGTYELSGNGSLKTALEYVGYTGGIGYFTQSGGTNFVSNGGSLILGYFGGSAGTYTLNGGSLSANGGEVVGYDGVGTFSQSGGTNTIPSNSNLIIAEDGSSHGSYLLSGTGALLAGNIEYVGAYGVGALTQTGGTNNTLGLILGQHAGSLGTYTISGGSAAINGSVYVGGSDSGPGGVGVLNVSGSGVLGVAGTLVAYNTPGSSVNLSGGTISAAALNFNGMPSLFNWTGGALILGSSVVLDSEAPATTTSAAFGPALAVGSNQSLYVLGDETVGGAGSFKLTVNSNGFNSIDGTLAVLPGSSVNLSGGTLSAAALNFNGMPSSFNWTSGTLLINSDLAFDSAAPGTTTSAAFGPALTLGSNQSLYVFGNETIGGVGPFSLTVNSNGVNSVQGALSVIPGSSINLSGGTIIAAALNFNGMPSLLNWTSGTLTLNSDVTFDSAAAGTTTSAAFGPALTLGNNGNNQILNVIGNETIGGAGPFSLTINSSGSNGINGTLTVMPASSVNLSGGYLAAKALNLNGTPSLFNWSSGNLVLSSNVTFDSAAPGSSTSAAFGPALTLKSDQILTLDGDETIGGAGPFSLTINNGGANRVSGVLSVNSTGSLTINGGGMVTASQIVLSNGGTIDLSGGGAIAMGGNGFNSPTAGSVLLGSGAILGGVGTIKGAVFNGGGSLLPGFSAQSGLSPGVLNLTGGYAQAAGASLGFLIGGPTPGNGPGNYAQLIVGGAANLAGTMALSPFNGFFPAPGDKFTVMTYSSYTGAFSAITGTSPAPGLTYSVVYEPNSLVVLTTTTGTKTWEVDSDGSWSLASNWTGGIAPGGIGDSAALTTITTASRTVTLDTDTTLGIVKFDSPNNYTIAGLHILTFQAAGANPALIVVASAHGNGAHVLAVPITVKSPLNIEQDSAGTFRLAGPIDDSAGYSISKTGSGTLEFAGAPNLGTNTTVAVNGGMMRFAVISGLPAVGSGVQVAINNGATLELAGSISALASGTNRVGIYNASTASAGVLVSGINQIVGGIDGSGSIQVNASSDLTADHIIQSALVIQGSAGNPAVVTIDASDSSGNPLVANLPSISPLSSSDVDAASPGVGGSIASTSAAGLAIVPARGTVGSQDVGVPEPSSLVMLAIAGICSKALVRTKRRPSSGMAPISALR